MANHAPFGSVAMDWRAHVETALNGEHPVLGRSVVLLLYLLIGFSTVSIGLGTLPGLPAWAASALAIGEVVTVAVFTVEYGLRIAVAERKLAYEAHGEGSLKKPPKI